MGILLVPQGMAYAVLAGMPPVYGLFSATVPLIVYAFSGASRQLSVGPAAIVSLLIASGVSQWATPGSAQYISLVIQLSLLAGMVQLLAGGVRLGYLANFLSRPVIHGFSSAAALVIMGSQVGNLLGIPIPRLSHLHEVILALLQTDSPIHWPTVAIGGGAMGIILVAKRIHRSIPGPLIAIVAGTLMVFGFGLSPAGVKIVGNIPSGAPPLSVPALSIATLRMLWPQALIIGFVGFLESFAVAKAMATKHPGQLIGANREFLALGAANVAGAFFSAYPVAGGFGRTAVNERAGAVTQMASLISALVVLLSLLFLTPLFFHLPSAVLAAMIVLAVIPLVAVGEMRHLWQTDKRDFVMLLASFFGTLTLGVEMGIGVAVVLSLLLVVYNASNPHCAVLGKLPGSRHYMNIERFPEATTCDDILVFRFDGPLFFGNAGVFEDRLHTLVKARGDVLRLVVLDASAIHSMDSTSVHTLEGMLDTFDAMKIHFYTAYVRGPIRDVMKRGGLYERIGTSNHFMTVADAVDWFIHNRRKEESKCLSNN